MSEKIPNTQKNCVMDRAVVAYADILRRRKIKMKQLAWKIIYHKYEGLEKKAVDFLSKEAGK